MIIYPRSTKTVFGAVFFLFFLAIPQFTASGQGDQEIDFVCPEQKDSPPRVLRSQVYRDVPFGPGEAARYAIRYYRALVGYGTLEVRNPVNVGGVWHRSFHAEGKTGDWYRLIFVAHDKVHAISRPWDFGVTQFYMEQDEGQMFGRRLERQRWLDFDHNGCSVSVRTVDKRRPERNETYDFVPGAVDALSAIYKLRTLDYKMNETQRIKVYSSGKNWWLEAEPVSSESISVEAGKFNTLKLRLKTFLGDELQQRGDVHVWIAHEHPQQPIVKIQGEIRIGSVTMSLVEFKAGS